MGYGAGRWKFTVPMINSEKIEQQQQQQQQSGKAQKQQKGNKKGGNQDTTSSPKNRSQPSSAAPAYNHDSSDLPPPWVSVPDPNSGKMYYWNQTTNETTWNHPGKQPGSPSQRNQRGMQQQTQQDLWTQQVAFMQQQQSVMQQQFMAGFGMPHMGG